MKTPYARGGARATSAGGTAPRARGAVCSAGLWLMLAACRTDQASLELPEGGAPLNDYFAVEVSVPGPRPDAVEIDADMPEHHHGMLSEPVVTEVAPGRWRAEGMLLHMPGDWEIYVTVLRNGRRERGVFPLHLEPY